MAGLSRKPLIAAYSYATRHFQHIPKLAKSFRNHGHFTRYTLPSVTSLLSTTRVYCTKHNQTVTNTETVISSSRFMNSVEYRATENKREVERTEAFESVLTEMLDEDHLPDQDDLQEWHARLEKYRFWPLQMLRMLSEQTASKRKTLVSFMLLDYAVISMNVSGIALEVHRVITLLSLGSTEHADQGYHLFKDLENKYGIFDKTTEGVLVDALSQTKYWQEACRLMFEPADNKPRFHRSILQAAVQHEDWDVCSAAMELMKNFTTENVKTVFSPSNPSTSGFLMLHAMQKNGWVVPSIEDMQMVDQWFSRRSWTSQPTTISSSGVCGCCGRQLNPLIIDPAEFNVLRKSFIDTALIGKDVFRSCHPLELKDFRNFLKKKPRKFDVVIDGLNVLYSSKRNSKDVKHVRTVVSSLVDMGYNVLLMGRKHLHKTLKSIMPEIEAKASYFFISNLSKDDPFILHAALESGINTRIVAMDSYRDFISKMGPDLGKTLDNWLQTHRIQIHSVPDSNEVKFEWPPTYAVQVHEDTGCYHIPYATDGDRLTVQHLHNWRCVQKTV